MSAAPDAEAASAERSFFPKRQIANVDAAPASLLVAAPAVAGLVAVAAFVAWVQVGADVEDSQLKISRQMAQRRAALSSGRNGVFEEATAKLAERKRETSATVIVLKSLSQALPDDTYLTELHVVDGKLEITGVTREAAS